MVMELMLLLNSTRRWAWMTSILNSFIKFQGLQYTNLLDLGVWCSLQSTVEKMQYQKRTDVDTLVSSVYEAWNTSSTVTGLDSPKLFTNVRYVELHLFGTAYVTAVSVIARPRILPAPRPSVDTPAGNLGGTTVH